MRFFIAALSFFLLCFRISSALETTKFESTDTISPFTDQQRFVILNFFAENSLRNSLKKTLIIHLQKIGNVFLNDDKNLTEKEKEDKYRPGGMILEIVASNIYEEAQTIKELPVVEIKMKVISGVEIIENKSKATGILWEQVKFIEVGADKKLYEKRALEAMDSILDKFKEDYEQANPKSEGKKPQFYLCL